MNDNKRPLYIPIKTLDSDDFIEGIGKLEVAFIGAGVMAGLILGISVSGIMQNSLVGVAVSIVFSVLTIGIFRRDGTNENMIRKLVIIHRFIKTQKRYLYQYYNVLEAMKINQEETGRENRVA
ncbi:hypothetical protein B6K86_09155 [Lachnospiraceae bacterium]|nr:hypothetical protein B6K86_09155 [Lachnospiraceae bacterium]